MERREEEEGRKTTAEEEEGRKTTAKEEEEEGRKTTIQILEEGDDEEENEHSDGEEEQKNGDDEDEHSDGEEEQKNDDDEEEDEHSDGEEEQKNGGEEEDDDDDDDDDDAELKKKKMTKQKAVGSTFPDRKCVPGIVYLGHIPPRLRPKHLRNLLSVFGEIGRIFLQPEDGQVRRRKRKSGLRRCDFTEGWVEFRDKRVAKRVVLSLHNTPMGTRKRQRFSSDLWSIKYLHRFQWTHLSERLAFEQTVLQQRLRTEVSQAKRETNFYLNNVDKSAHMDHLRRKRQRAGQEGDEKTWDFTQHQTEEEIQKKKKRKKDSFTQKHLDKASLIQQKSQSNVSLLAKIFNSNQSE